MVQQYKRNFMIEFGLDAKAFSNYYRLFYLTGNSFKSF
jgi:hypothetical protein